LTDSRESQSPPDGDNVNIHVANPTTSAQYFHLLRRQVKIGRKRQWHFLEPIRNIFNNNRKWENLIIKEKIN
jgi:2-oxoglutarate dehydrogenase complex dehydrogenase (E1) component-like enzyme